MSAEKTYIYAKSHQIGRFFAQNNGFLTENTVILIESGPISAFFGIDWFGETLLCVDVSTSHELIQIRQGVEACGGQLAHYQASELVER